MSDDLDLATHLAICRHLRSVDTRASEECAFDLLDDRYPDEEFSRDAVEFLGVAIRAQLDACCIGASSAMRSRFDGPGAEALRIARTQGAATLLKETGPGMAAVKKEVVGRLVALSAFLPEHTVSHKASLNAAKALVGTAQASLTKWLDAELAGIEAAGAAATMSTDVVHQTAVTIERHMGAVDAEAAEELAVSILGADLSEDQVLHLSGAIYAAADVIQRAARGIRIGAFGGRAAEVASITRTQGAASLLNEVIPLVEDSRAWLAEDLALLATAMPEGGERVQVLLGQAVARMCRALDVELAAMEATETVAA
jgi:hypothetical protein